MMNKILLLLLSLSFLICSCNSKEQSNELNSLDITNEKEAFYNDLESHFYKDMGKIVIHKESEYDLIPEILILNADKDIQVRMKFFNYGGDIRVCNCFRDNVYVNSFGEIKAIVPIYGVANIENVSPQESEDYGEWATADVYIGGNQFKDTFFTPLAFADYKKGDFSECLLVFIQAKRRHLVAVFKADPDVHLFAKQLQNCIIPDEDIINIEAPTTGPGNFWKYNK